MPCYRPLSAWLHYNTSGGARKCTVVFGGDHKNSYDTAKSVDLPCGRCIGCRLERSRQWAVRLMHEKQMHERACFITLTYSDSKLPSDGSLDLDHFQRFMKRLRRGSSGPLRFFHCGEYGEETARPHYHACIFGEDFSADRQPYKRSPRGDQLYNSARLSEAWGYGHAVIGDLTFESAAYVARYCLKKITGPQAEAHYQGRKPEYVTMSRRPGIGADWFKKYTTDVYPSDSVVMRGREMLPPKFYDRLIEQADPALFERVKRERALSADSLKWSEETRTTRLHVREKVKAETVKQTLKRKHNG